MSTPCSRCKMTSCQSGCRRFREAVIEIKAKIDDYSARDETMGRAVFDGNGVYEIIRNALDYEHPTGDKE